MLLRFFIFFIHLLSALDGQPEKGYGNRHNGQAGPPDLGHQYHQQGTHPENDIGDAAYIIEPAQKLPHRVRAHPVDQFPGVIVLHMPVFQRCPLLGDSGSVYEIQAHLHFQIDITHQLPVQVIVGNDQNQAQQGHSDGRLFRLSRKNIQGAVDKSRRGQHLQGRQKGHHCLIEYLNACI